MKWTSECGRIRERISWAVGELGEPEMLPEISRGVILGARDDYCGELDRKI
jgi:hypothetical protein